MPITTMPTEYGSGTSVSFRGRSFLSLRRNQVASMEQGHEEDLHELDLFQTHVAERLDSLVSSAETGGAKILSLPFLQKLLDALLECEEEFKSLIVVLLDRTPPNVPKPALDRTIADLLDRAVKSLDICNAVTDAVHSLRHWLRHADIAASALLSRSPLGPAQLNRAAKALGRLLAPTSSNPPDSRHHRSDSGGGKSFSLSRTMSWGSRSGTGTRQVQAVWANLAAHRGGDAIAVAVYTMCSVLVFAMWAMVAAFPCGERGGHHRETGGMAAPPRGVAWAGAMLALQERVGEEWRRKGGSLAEVGEVERCGRGVMEAKGEGEVGAKAEELAEACRRMEEGMGPLERQVREVFHRLVGSRAELLKCLDHNNHRCTGVTLPIVL